MIERAPGTFGGRGRDLSSWCPVVLSSTGRRAGDAAPEARPIFFDFPIELNEQRRYIVASPPAIRAGRTNDRMGSTSPISAFERAVEAAGGIEEVRRRMAELRRRLADEPPESRSGIRRVAYPDLGEPAAPEEIRLLLADAPEKAIDAIGRMEYLPESLERPFGPRERLVSDAICDRSLPKGTRVRLLCSVGNDRTFDGLPPVEARDVPLGFLDSNAGCFSTSARTGMANMRPPGWKRPRRSSLESSGRASTPWAATCSGTRSTTRATERPKRRSSATAAIPMPKRSGA